MAARGAAEAAAGNVRAPGFGLLRHDGSWRGNVRDALVRRGGPLSAEEILLVLRLVKIVRHRVEGAKRRVVIADTGHVVVVGIDVLRADRRRLTAWPTTGE